MRNEPGGRNRGPGAGLPLVLSLLAALALVAAWMSGLFRSVTIRLPRRALPAALAGSLLAASVALPLDDERRCPIVDHDAK